MSRIRAAWLAATPAPYRVPLWRALSHHVDLRVFMLDSHHPYEAFNDEPDPSVHIERVAARRVSPSSSGWAASFPRGLGRMLDQWSPSLVIVPGWELPGYWSAAHWARKHGATTVGYYGTAPGSSRHTRGPVAEVRRRILNSFDGIVTYGSATTHMLDEWRIAAPRIVTGFNCSDLDAISRAVQASRASLIAQPLRQFRFLVLGRLLERKNVGAVIDAMRHPGLRDAHLDIVGDGPCLPHLVEQATSLHVEDRVSFRGALRHAEVASALATSQCLLLPSTEEVWGLTAAEGLAAGLSVVCSGDAGIAADIEHMPGVSIVPPSAEDFASAMSRSMQSWKGYVTDPEILRFTPDALAECFLEAARG